jgi:hypothetical protein
VARHLEQNMFREWEEGYLIRVSLGDWNETPHRLESVGAFAHSQE